MQMLATKRQNVVNNALLVYTTNGAVNCGYDTCFTV